MTHLAAVAGRHQQGGEGDEVEFCSHCGQLGGEGPLRVCTSCGLGVRLRTSRGALQSDAAPFLIVRADGVISAASAAAERQIPHEGPLLGRPLLTLLSSEDDLASAVSRAARGAVEVTAMPVTPRTRGRTMRATIAPCGDPPAALVVVDPRP